MAASAAGQLPGSTGGCLTSNIPSIEETMTLVMKRSIPPGFGTASILRRGQLKPDGLRRDDLGAAEKW